MNIIEIFFVAACRQLWSEFVGDPQLHLWALAVMRTCQTCDGTNGHHASCEWS